MFQSYFFVTKSFFCFDNKVCVVVVVVVVVDITRVKMPAILDFQSFPND